MANWHCRFFVVAKFWKILKLCQWISKQRCWWLMKIITTDGSKSEEKRIRHGSAAAICPVTNLLQSGHLLTVQGKASRSKVLQLFLHLHYVKKPQLVTAVFLVFQSANGAALIHPAVVRGFGGDEKNWSLTMHSLSGCCSSQVLLTPSLLPARAHNWRKTKTNTREHTTARHSQRHKSTQLKDKAKDTRVHNWKTKTKTRGHTTYDVRADICFLPETQI